MLRVPELDNCNVLTQKKSADDSINHSSVKYKDIQLTGTNAYLLEIFFLMGNEIFYTRVEMLSFQRIFF